MLTVIASVIIAAGPPVWKDGSVEKALKEAAGKKPVLALVHAHWCGPCNELGNELLDTPAGAKLLRRAIGVRVDFDTAAGRAATEKYGVINLPTLLVLDKKGAEIGRVEGYEGRDEYLLAVENARRGKAGVEALRKESEANPGDLVSLVAYAQARLVRGGAEEAKPLLDKAMAAGGTIGANAARIWGRWLLRVKRDGPAATEHFLTYMRKYKGDKVADGFLYWAARGYQLQGKNGAAIKLFDDWIGRDPRSYRAAIYKSDFMAHNKYDPRETEVVVRFAIGLDDSKPGAHYLLAEVLLRKGDKKGAEAAIRQAIAMKPKAIYENFAQRRLGITIGGDSK